MNEKLTYAIFGFIVAQVFCVVSLCNCLDKFSYRINNSFKDIRIETSDRYEVKQIGSMAKNQFLLDKQTGKIWQRVVDPKTNDDWFTELHVENRTISEDNSEE